jgi:hypothetical protein
MASIASTPPRWRMPLLQNRDSSKGHSRKISHAGHNANCRIYPRPDNAVELLQARPAEWAMNLFRSSYHFQVGTELAVNIEADANHRLLTCSAFITAGPLFRLYSTRPFQIRPRPWPTNSWASISARSNSRVHDAPPEATPPTTRLTQRD